MVFDVLVVASLVGAIWWWQSRPLRARPARHADDERLLPYDDLPPIGAFEPLPEPGSLDEYVQGGLQQLTSYLTGRDRTV